MGGKIQRQQLIDALYSDDTPKVSKQYIMARLDVNDDILEERHRQIEKHGHQRHRSINDQIIIIGEEFGEVCQAAQANEAWAKPTDAKHLYEEAIQLAASAAKLAEKIKLNSLGV